MKSFLRLGMLAMILGLLSVSIAFARAGEQQAGDTGAATTEARVQNNAAPILARLVAEGKLASVDQRLPQQPVITGPGVLNGTEWPDWTPGRYEDGRVLQTVSLTAKVSVMDISLANFLWAPDQTSKDLISVLVEDYTASPDYTVSNFVLHKGMRWSNVFPARRSFR